MRFSRRLLACVLFGAAVRQCAPCGRCIRRAPAARISHKNSPLSGEIRELRTERKKGDSAVPGVVIIRKVLCLLAFIAAGLWHGAPAAGAGAAVDYEPLREELTAYLDGRAGEHGFFFVDLGTGTSTGYNARDPFHGASPFKVPLNLYLFREIAAGRVNPDPLLVYRKAHYEGGTGCLRE